MQKTAVTTAFLAGTFTVLSLVSLDAAACGESLFRVGKGMSYRAHTAPLPGNVIVVTQTQAHKDFADRLAAAGHHVQTVDDASELSAALSRGEFDVVVAKFSDREIVAEQFASSATRAAYLPVTVDESEEGLAKQLYDKPLAESDSFTDFLKAIHKTLKRA